jgi:hypothetical protein
LFKLTAVPPFSTVLVVVSVKITVPVRTALGFVTSAIVAVIVTGCPAITGFGLACTVVEVVSGVADPEITSVPVAEPE